MKNKNLTDIANQKNGADKILRKLLLNYKRISGFLKLYYENIDDHKKILLLIC